MSGTRMAAFLFCDLVGSTALQSRLGDDAADPVRRSVHGVLREAVRDAGGREVKNLGDGIMAVFTSAADAVGCAVAMQQGIGRLGARLGLDLAVRVGVSAGEATEEEGDWFGTPVIEAARLCGRADGGRILVSELAHQVVAPRQRHKFSAVGALELKGLPVAVVTYEAGWEPADESPPGVPDEVLGSRAEAPAALPGRLRVAPPFGFFGRTAERDVLENAWKEAADGRRRVVLVSGEPGVGKTGLAAEFSRALHAQGALVLYGRCDEDLGLPYQPFIEAARAGLDAGSGTELQPWVDAHGDALAHVLPEVSRRFPGVPSSPAMDAETERYRFFQAMIALLARLSAVRPVLVVLDDLHWATQPTLLLLKHLVASSEPMAVLVLGTYRESDVSRDHPLADLLAELRREASVDRIPLRGLGDDEVVALVEGAAGHALEDEMVAFAHAAARETDGNPFFLTEILRHLAESGAVVHERDRWVAAGDLAAVHLPASVRDVIGHRVRRLGEEAGRVLSVAAVIGRDFDDELLARAAEVDDDVLLDVLEAATGAALVTEVPGRPGRFSFSHALVQHALYEDLGGLRRVRAHQRVAAALEALCGDDPGERVAQLAHHWITATRPAEPLKAIDYAMRAGDRALDQLVPEEAAGWYAQALQLHTDRDASDELRLELLIRLGEAQRRAGQAAFRQSLLEASTLARRRGDNARLVRAVLASNRGTFSAAGEVDHEKVEALEAARAALGNDHTTERARVLATLASELTFSGAWERRRDLADEALAVARRLGDDATLARVLNLRASTIQVSETVTERMAGTAENLEVTGRLGDPLERYFALWTRRLAAAEAGDRAEADRALDELEQLAGALGQPALRWYAMNQRVVGELLAGRIEDAERLAADAVQLGHECEGPEAFVIYTLQLFTVRLDQGRLGELEPVIAQAMADNPGLPVVRALLALAYTELERTDDARRVFAIDAANDFSDLPYDLTWGTSLSALSQVCGRLEDREAAAVLFEKLRPSSGVVSHSVVFTLGAIDRYLGLLAATLGRFDEAEAYFRSAARLHEEIGAPAWLARTHLDWGRLLVQRGGPGDTDRPRRLLNQALATALDLGLCTVERRARSLLEAVP
ncbi:MAG: ATP-binding protein [Acidimicrobiia bacterium]